MNGDIETSRKEIRDIEKRLKSIKKETKDLKNKELKLLLELHQNIYGESFQAFCLKSRLSFSRSSALDVLKDYCGLEELCSRGYLKDTELLRRVAEDLSKKKK